MSRQQLFDAMVSRMFVSLYSRHFQTNLCGYINGIAVEDGSGFSFIVKLNTKVVDDFYGEVYKNIDMYYRCNS